MKDFRSLKVWEMAYALTLTVYKATEQFPKHELYSPTNQIQRAAVTIPANIAEGCGKDSGAELKCYSLLQWDRQANWNTFSYLHVIQVIYPKLCINPYKVKLAKCLMLYSKTKS